MGRFRGASQVLAITAGEVLAIVALHRLGEAMAVDWQDLIQWLAVTPLEQAVAALLRLVALALAYWLAASTVLYTLAVASRIPTAIRAVEWATLPEVQRIARKAAAATLAVSVASPGLAGAVLAPPSLMFETRPAEASTLAPEEPTIGVTDEGLILPPGSARPAYTPRPAPDLGSLDAIPTAPTLPAAAQSEEPPEGTVFTPTPVPNQREVVRGDNLWDISASHLAATTGRDDLSDADIAPYWARVVAANADTLRSGNPDMIHPGETIRLPPFEEN